DHVVRERLHPLREHVTGLLPIPSDLTVVGAFDIETCRSGHSTALLKRLEAGRRSQRWLIDVSVVGAESGLRQGEVWVHLYSALIERDHFPPTSRQLPPVTL